MSLGFRTVAKRSFLRVFGLAGRLEGGWFQGHTENGRAKFSITTLHLHTRKGQNLNNRLYGRAEFFNADLGGWMDIWARDKGSRGSNFV